MGRRRKGPPAGPPEKDDGFDVMFISLNLILLSFFILLNSMAVRDSKKTRKALGSLLGTFGILGGGHNTTREGSSVLPTDPMGNKKQEKQHNQARELEALLEKIKQKHGRDKIKVIPTADNLQVEFSDRVMFRAAGVELNPKVFPVLDEIARVMRIIGRGVVVQGFTDPRKPQNYPSNLELSGARAVRVARYLMEAGQLDPKLVRAEGHGVTPRQLTKARVVRLVVPTRSLRARLKDR